MMQLARIRLYLKIKIKKTYVYTSPQNKRRFMLLIEQDISFIAPSRKKNNKLISMIQYKILSFATRDRHISQLFPYYVMAKKNLLLHEKCHKHGNLETSKSSAHAGVALKF